MSTSRKVRASIQLLIGLAAFVYIAYCVIDAATTPGVELIASHCIIDVAIGASSLYRGVRNLTRGDRLNAYHSAPVKQTTTYRSF